MIRRPLALVLTVLASATLADRFLARGILGGGRPSARPIRSLVVVDAPIDAVWEAISDVPAQPRWMHEMKAIRLATPGPVGVGTRGEADVRILGIGVTDPVEISAWEPPRRYGIRHLGLFTGGGEITLRPSADGTTTVVTWSETLVPPVLPELGALVGRSILGRIFQDDLHRFRELVESGAWAADRASSP